MLATQKYPIDMDSVVIEDGEAVDSILSEKLMRILTEVLYSSWQPEGKNKDFLANANVGIFSELLETPIVPDIMLSLKVKTPSDWLEKSNRSYFLENFGKPPEVVIEIVSNKQGHEKDEKFMKYQILGVKYYIIYDPLLVYQESELECYVLEASGYKSKQDSIFEDINLGLCIWEGEFENSYGRWLRWCDKNGKVIPTGKEKADDTEVLMYAEMREKLRERREREKERQEKIKEYNRAEKEYNRAEKEYNRAEKEKQEKERLIAKLRELGINPDEIE